MKKIGALLLCCCLAFAVGALADEPVQMPDFTLASISGEDVSLSDFEGRQIVLYFWATWCPACVQGLPEKQALQEWMLENDFPGEVWAVNLTDGVRETRDSCAAFVERHGYTLPVLYDEGGEVFGWIGSNYLPVTVIINEAGYIKGGTIGSMPMDQIIALLEDNT
ncbi:MAG: TlpA family protein disulfide reductase [Clostridia bacterium]|nr:TlpA family protein disulfide reductase [Clostridia bacterium]